jgi:hypothetical protein
LQPLPGSTRMPHRIAGDFSVSFVRWFTIINLSALYPHNSDSLAAEEIYKFRATAKRRNEGCTGKWHRIFSINTSTCRSPLTVSVDQRRVGSILQTDSSVLNEIFLASLNLEEKIECGQWKRINLSDLIPTDQPPLSSWK